MTFAYIMLLTFGVLFFVVLDDGINNRDKRKKHTSKSKPRTYYKVSQTLFGLRIEKVKE